MGGVLNGLGKCLGWMDERRLTRLEILGSGIGTVCCRVQEELFGGVLVIFDVLIPTVVSNVEYE